MRELYRVKMPRFARRIAPDRLGPELIAVAGDSVSVYHPQALNRPEAPAPGPVLEVFRLVSRAGKHPLPRVILCQALIRGAVIVARRREKRLDPRDVPALECVELRYFVNPLVAQHDIGVLLADRQRAITEPRFERAERLEPRRLARTLLSFQHEHAIGFTAWLECAGDRGEHPLG